MKIYFLKIVLFIVILLGTSGCYTVIWTPEDKFPTEKTTTEYYDEIYYGDYYSFYGYPWWLRFSPPNTPIDDNYYRNQNESTSSIRNEGSGRSTDNGRNIMQTNPPSKDIAPRNTTTGSSNINSSTTGNSSTVNSNSNSGNRNSDNSSIRNNDGNRNTEDRRK